MMLQGIRIVSRVRIFSIKYHQDVWTITKMILNKTGKGRGINSNFASQKKKSSSAYEKTFNQDLKNMANDSKYCKHIWSVTGIDPQNDVSKDFRESGEFKREKIEKIT